jgi:hypothetical protein
MGETYGTNQNAIAVQSVNTAVHVCSVMWVELWLLEAVGWGRGWAVAPQQLVAPCPRAQTHRGHLPQKPEHNSSTVCIYNCVLTIVWVELWLQTAVGCD